MTKKQDPLTEARLRNARYAGLLAAWASLAGCVAPGDVDREEHNLQQFGTWLERKAEERRLAKTR